jgi:hypothetical protein
MARKRVAPVTDAKGTLEVKLLTQRKQATGWPGATSVKMENRIKKILETASLSQSTPVKTEEREPAPLAAAFRALPSLIEFGEPAWHSGVSKLRSLASDVSRTRSEERLGR